MWYHYISCGLMKPFKIHCDLQPLKCCDVVPSPCRPLGSVLELTGGLAHGCLLLCNRSWSFPAELCNMQRRLYLIVQPLGLTTANGAVLSQESGGAEGEEVSITKAQIKQKAVGGAQKYPGHTCWELECRNRMFVSVTSHPEPGVCRKDSPTAEALACLWHHSFTETVGGRPSAICL